MNLDRGIFEREIQKKTGVQFLDIPKDGKVRSFKVGYKSWFAVRFEDCGAFGCFAQNTMFGWCGALSYEIKSEPKERRLSIAEIKAERQIIVIGNAMADAGTPLSGEDLDRYILALSRSINYDAQQNRKEKNADAAR
jgi:hypothetical protein